uniref:Uncharacterized protein n=1 Tax=Ditylenchus dipsaci TaxID=166011 RepID=A0A915E2A8_9BILA
MEVVVEASPNHPSHGQDGIPIEIDNEHYVVKKEEEQGKHSLTIAKANNEDAGNIHAKHSQQSWQSRNFCQTKLCCEKKLLKLCKESQLSPLHPALESKSIKEVSRDNQPIRIQDQSNLVIEKLDDGTLKLKILNATKNEVGVYKLRRQQGWQGRTSAKLNYAQEVSMDQGEEEAPMLCFIKELRDQEVEEKSKVEFVCQLEPNAIANMPG